MYGSTNGLIDERKDNPCSLYLFSDSWIGHSALVDDFNGKFLLRFDVGKFEAFCKSSLKRRLTRSMN